MNIASYIFSGLFAVCLICSFAIPVRIVKKIMNCLIFPLMTGSTISTLTIWLPDSLHNVFVTIITFSLLSISVAFTNFKEYKKSFENFSVIFYILSFLPLINFLGTVFFLNHIPHYVIILCSLVYLLIAIGMIIFLKKQTPLTYSKIILTYLTAVLLNLMAFLALIYEFRLYAPFLFSGSLIILLNIVFTSLESTEVFKIKIGAIISKICQIIGYSLISTGLFFMVTM